MFKRFQTARTVPVKTLFKIEVHRVTFPKNQEIADASEISVCFERGGKMAASLDRTVRTLPAGAMEVVFSETLSMIVTMHKNTHSNSYQEKAGKLIVRQRRRNRNKGDCYKGVGVASLDLAALCRVDEPVTLTLPVQQCGIPGVVIHGTVTPKVLGECEDDDRSSGSGFSDGEIEDSESVICASDFSPAQLEGFSKDHSRLSPIQKSNTGISLQGRLADSLATIARLNSSLKKLEQENTCLIEAKRKRDEEVDSLRREVTFYRENCVDLEEQLNSQRPGSSPDVVQVDIRRLQDALDVEVRKTEKLKESLETERSLHTSASRALHTSSAEVQRLVALISSKPDISAGLSSCATCGKDVGIIADEGIIQQEQYIRELETELSYVLMDKTRLEDDVRVYHDRIAEYRHRLENFSPALGIRPLDLNSQNREVLERENKALQDENADLKERVQGLERRVEEISAERTALVSSVTAFQNTHVGMLEQARKLLDEEDMKQQEDMQTLRKEAQSARDQLVCLRDEISTLETRCAGHQQEIKNLRASEQALKDEVKERQDMKLLFQDEKSKWQKQKKTFQFEVNKLKRNELSLQGELRILKEAEINLQSEVKKLKESKATLQVDKKALKKNEVDLQSQVESLNTQLSSLESRVTSLQGERNELQVKLEGLTSQKASLEEMMLSLQNGKLDLEVKLRSESKIRNDLEMKLASIQDDMRIPPFVDRVKERIQADEISSDTMSNFGAELKIADDDTRMEGKVLSLQGTINEEVKFVTLQGDMAILRGENKKQQSTITALETSLNELQNQSHKNIHALQDKVCSLEWTLQNEKEKRIELETKLVLSDNEKQTVEGRLQMASETEQLLRGDIVNLEDAIAYLEQREMTLQDDKSLLRKELVIYHERENELRRDLMAVQEEKMALESELEIKTNELRGLDDQVTVLNNDISSLNSTIETLGADNESLRVKVSTVEHDLETARSLIASLEGEVKELRSRVEVMRGSRSRAEAALAAEKRTTADLREKLMNIEDKKWGLESELEGMKSSHVRMSREVSFLQEDKRQLDQAILALREEKRISDSRAASLEDEKMMWDREKTALQQENEGLEKSLEEAKEEISQNMQRKASLEGAQEAMGVAASVGERMRALLVEDRRRLQESVATLESDKHALQQEANILRTDTETLHSALSAAQQELDALRGEAENLRAEAESLAAANSEAECSISVLTAHKTMLEELLHEQLLSEGGRGGELEVTESFSQEPNAGSRASQVAEELMATRSTIIQYQQQIKEMSAQLKADEDEVSRLTRENSELSKNCDLKSSRIDILLDHVSHLEKSVLTKDKEIVALQENVTNTEHRCLICKCGRDEALVALEKEVRELKGKVQEREKKIENLCLWSVKRGPEQLLRSNSTEEVAEDDVEEAVLLSRGRIFPASPSGQNSSHVGTCFSTNPEEGVAEAGDDIGGVLEELIEAKVLAAEACTEVDAERKKVYLLRTRLQRYAEKVATLEVSNAELKAHFRRESLHRSVSSAIPGNYIYTGYLTKRGSFFPTWLRRRFFLYPGVLTYYDTDGWTKKGEFKITPQTVLKEKSFLMHAHCFCLVNPSRVLYMTADSEDEKSHWMAAILDVIRRVVCPEVSNTLQA